MAVGRPTLRSVDSQVKGRVIEPRKCKTLGALVVDICGGRVRQLTHGPLSCLILPGSKNTGYDHQGFQGTWETPFVSIEIPDGETGTDNSLAHDGDAHGRGEQPRATRWYRLVKITNGSRWTAGSRSVP